MWEAILGIAGPLVGVLLRHWFSERQWSKVRKVATAIVADPAQPSDPLQAAQQALLQVSLNRLVREARKVEAAFQPNGTPPK